MSYEQRIADHLLSVPRDAERSWLEAIEAATSGPPSLTRIKKALRLWIDMCAEIDIDWPALVREIAEDEVGPAMDRIMTLARRRE